MPDFLLLNSLVFLAQGQVLSSLAMALKVIELMLILVVLSIFME